MIVDVHSHIFPAVNGRIGTGPTRSLGYGRIQFGDRETQLMPPYNDRTEYTPEMLVANMDWAGVDKVVCYRALRTESATTMHARPWSATRSV